MSLEIVKNLRQEELDPQALSYYQEYSEKYYNDRFKSGEGVETILAMIRKYAKKGSWLDIGAGPATLFWSLMMPEITRIDCSEICKEGIWVLDNFFKSNVTPQCYQDVIDQYKIDPQKIGDVRHAPRDSYIFDALKTWPDLPNRPYDNIGLFGVFGLCSTAQAYVDCFAYPRPSLKSGGILMGANWVRSPKMVEKCGGKNDYLSTELIDKAAIMNGFKVLHNSEERIVGDENYTRVVVWCFQS